MIWLKCPFYGKEKASSRKELAVFYCLYFMKNIIPEVSIILPVYNGEKFLRTSIESCQKQTFTNWELLVIDDGSTDKSAEIVKEYEKQDSRIHYYKNEVNLKLPKTLNRGFSLAKGKYLTWTSDDNYYYPQAIEKMVQTLREYQSEFVFAKCSIINEEGKQIDTITAPPDYKQAIWNYNFIGACFLYSRTVYETIGDYDPNLFLCEDYDYWLRIFSKFPVTYLDEQLYVYRVHDKALSATHKNGQYEALEKVLLKNFQDKKDVTTLEKFYLYRSLHRSRSLRTSWREKYKYFPILFVYKIWHKCFCWHG